MGTIVLDKTLPYGKRVWAACQRRGLVPCPGSDDSEDEWIIHGPHHHPDHAMGYEVLIGYVKPRGDNDPRHEELVAVYPWAMYHLDGGTSDDWWKVTPEERIPTTTTKRRHRAR